MSLADHSTAKTTRGPRWPSPWSAGAALIAAVVLGPILAVLWIAAFPAENIWPHLVSTTLPRYMSNTLVLMFGVGVLAGCAGSGAAWLIARYEFPGRSWLEYLLLHVILVPLNM